MFADKMDPQTQSQTPVTKDSVLELIHSKGPNTPLNISRALGVSTLFVSTFLTELVESKDLSVANVRLAGSPIYYLTGHPEKLQDFSKYLNEKDRKAYDLLKKEKILKDSEQNPFIQASLRSIKDFSVLLNVRFDGK